MHKLVILLPTTIDSQKFERHWHDFLRLAEKMPGLQRETSSLVQVVISGQAYERMHELYFADYTALELALYSQMGQAAGKMLHYLSDGRVTLFTAEHQEDTLPNIQAHASPEPPQA
ncbi:MAG: hypothetical protein OHK0052_20480 [Anaerolineales bacterium]